MSLFKKKKDEKKEIQCACANRSNESSTCCGKEINGICCVKVLGAGCASCHQMYENAKEAVKSIGVAIEVEYITDLQKVMEYGVMTVPALVVNDKVVSAGKVLKTAEIENYLKKQK